jgi:hypothetical protein
VLLFIFGLLFVSCSQRECFLGVLPGTTMILLLHALFSKILITIRKMLNSTPGALVKHINIEILSSNLCISYKNCLFNINFIFLFLFWICLTSTPGALFSITLTIKLKFPITKKKSKKLYFDEGWTTIKDVYNTPYIIWCLDDFCLCEP